MSNIIAKRLQKIKPSPTLGLNAYAAELRAAGKDIISLSVGESDLAPPEHARQAAMAAIDNNLHNGYTAPDGSPDLKKAIINKFKRDNNLDYSASQIIVSTGAKYSLFAIFQTLLNPGDEIIIPAPYWVSYPDMALIAEAKPIVINTMLENDFKITPEQLDAAITPSTKLLVLNSPSNPTGMVYSASELQALAAVLLKHPHVYIISDDIYEHIYWADKPFTNVINQCPELYQRTIVVNGISKAYAMTGWRIGYAAGPEVIVKSMKSFQSQSTANPCSIAQVAAEAALNGPQHYLSENLAIYQRKQKLALSALEQINGIRCGPTQGAFYLFPEISGVIQQLGLKNDLEFSEFLLKEAQVAMVPGTAFGSPNHIRLSYATSDELLTEALQRIGDLIQHKTSAQSH